MPISYYFQKIKIIKTLCLGLIFFIAIFLSACAKQKIISVPCGPKSTKLVSSHSLPVFNDDMDIESLKVGVASSLRYWQKQGVGGDVEFCGKSYSKDQVIESLKLFADLVSTTNPDSLSHKIKENFDVCQARGQGNALVTGYFQPTFRGSLVPEAPFLYPLYGYPKDLVKNKTPQKGQPVIKSGRLVDGQLQSYWSRAEIENGNLLAGQELVYLDDPVKAFFLHIQGSGLISFPDGSTRSILFAGTNDLPYRSIGKLLAEEGKIPLEEMSMPRIRQYLHEHLDEQQRILHYNKRFVFFRWGEDDGNHQVFGSMGEKLIPERSAALDSQCYPVGIPAFLESEKPIIQEQSVVGWQPVNRFVFHHDSGAAIKGPGRLDLFFGRGEYAELAAGVMKQPGRLYFFMKKQ